MTIIAEVKEEKIEETIEYPFIGICEGVVVLFKNESEGTVLKSSEEFWKQGEYSKGWFMHRFKKLKGEITLKNA